MNPDLRGRTCMVTGASSGIGLAAARELGRLGADVVLVCRSPERAEAARAEVVRAANHERVSIELCDFASQADTRQCAARYLESGRPLHVLLNNAGIVNQRRRLTEDGLEETFAVNHLGYFLFTNLLVPRLVESRPSRIVNVASDAHRGTSLDLGDLQSENGYRVMRVYGRSKLANILFTRELARRLEGTGVTANALHPGFVGTRLAGQNGALARFIMWAARPLARSPEKGAETAVYLASAPELEKASGGYYFDRKSHEPDAAAQDDETALRLWEESEALTGLAGMALPPPATDATPE